MSKNNSLSLNDQKGNIIGIRLFFFFEKLKKMANKIIQNLTQKRPSVSVNKNEKDDDEEPHIGDRTGRVMNVRLADGVKNPMQVGEVVDLDNDPGNGDEFNFEYLGIDLVDCEIVGFTRPSSAGKPAKVRSKVTNVSFPTTDIGTVTCVKGSQSNWGTLKINKINKKNEYLFVNYSPKTNIQVGDQVEFILMKERGKTFAVLTGK